MVDGPGHEQATRLDHTADVAQAPAGGDEGDDVVVDGTDVVDEDEVLVVDVVDEVPEVDVPVVGFVLVEELVVVELVELVVVEPVLVVVVPVLDVGDDVGDPGSAVVKTTST